MMEQNFDVLKIECVKVEQFGVEFYLAKLSAFELFSIVSVTHRIIMGFDDQGLPIYNDFVQRKPNPSRVKAIKDYLLNDDNPTFPNNILINIPGVLLFDEVTDVGLEKKIVQIDKTKINLTSTDKPLYVQIIDGQHRFSGLQEAYSEAQDSDKKDSLRKFEFVLSIFIDEEIDFQAMLFSTINRTPVKPSADLVYDLFGLLETDSPQKTSLAIVLELNGTKDSPFYKRVRLLGKKIKGEDSPISQGIFVRILTTLISPNLRVAEIERFKKRKELESGATQKTIFRKYYAESKDKFIYKTLFNYFDAVRETFVDNEGNKYWDFNETSDNPLQRTIGFLALIDVLTALFPIGLSNKDLTKEFFKEKLLKAKSIKLLDDNNQSVYAYSSVGKNKLQEDLMSLIFN